MPLTETEIAKRWRPLRLAIKIALAIFVSEAAVMFMLNFVFSFSHEMELVLDPFLLVLILTPILYFYVFAPMKWTIAQKETAEDARTETEERFKTLIDKAGDAVIGIEPPGVINIWNKKATEIFGYSQTEALGKDIHALIAPPRYHEAAYAGLSKFFSEGTGRLIGKPVEVQALRKDGKEFGIELSISVVRHNGAWNAIAIARDITERKRLVEEAISNLDEAERMNRLMVGRELKMEELRKEVRQLRERMEETEKAEQKHDTA